MFLTIKELRDHIQRAKEQLIAAAAVWMDSQRALLTREEKESWLNAVNMAERGLMQDSLKASNFPFGRYDTADEQVNVDVLGETQKEAPALSLQGPNSSVMIIKSTYSPYSSCNAAFLGLCHLTTLLDQLYQLDELLSPIELFIDLKQLNWAHTMTKGICKELSVAPIGVETLEHYRQRLQIAQGLYTAGQQNNSQAFELFDEQLHARKEQFATTLHCFVDSLNEAYALVEDKRFWFIRSLSAYLPWHGMLHQLAINLFEKDGVVHPDHKLLRIQSSKLNTLNSLFAREQKKSKSELLLLHMNVCNQIELRVEEIVGKLDSMTSNVNALQLLTSKRNTFLLRPTFMMGPWNFFRTLDAIYVAARQPLIRKEEDDHAATTDIKSVASSSNGW